MSIQDLSPCDQVRSQNVRLDELNENTNLLEAPEAQTHRREKSSDDAIVDQRQENSSVNGSIDARHRIIQSESVGRNVSQSAYETRRGGSQGVDANCRPVRGMRGRHNERRETGHPYHNANNSTHSVQGQSLVRRGRDKRNRGGGSNRIRNVSRIHHMALIRTILLYFCIK